MKYTPYSEQELREMALISEGTYQFEVMEVHLTDKYHNPLKDKAGNDMAKLKLKIWDKNGRERYVFTNLFGDGKMAFRTRHFADSIGRLDDYEKGTFEIGATLGDTGYAQIIVRKGNVKENGELWPDSNDVKDFIVKADQGFTPKADVLEFNDDIPNM